MFTYHRSQICCLDFRSGKIVCTGAKSVETVHKSLWIVFKELRDLQIEVEENPEITVQNIVSSADLGRSPNLSAIAIGLGIKNIECELEQFPGLVYRLDESEVVALLFGFGKLVVAGGKEIDDARQAIDVIVERLEDLGLLE